MILGCPAPETAWSRVCVEWKRNLMAHGDAWEEKWRGKRRMVWVISSFQFDSEQSIQCYYNRSPPTLTPSKPVLDWTDNPADINGLVRFAGRPNLVSARVPSHPGFTLMQRKVSSRVQRIRCQLTGPAIALIAEPCTTGRSDFAAGVGVQSS